MLSIEEIKLLIEKLEKVKKEDLQKLLDQNLKLLKGFALAIDAYNQEEIQRLDKTIKWFRLDLEKKRNNPIVDDLLYRQIVTTIYKFAKTDRFNSLEIGPGTGMFSKDMRAWKSNYYLEVLPELEDRIRAAENVVRILPPLNVKKTEINLAVKIIRKVCKQCK